MTPRPATIIPFRRRVDPRHWLRGRAEPLDDALTYPGGHTWVRHRDHEQMVRRVIAKARESVRVEKGGRERG